MSRFAHAVAVGALIASVGCGGSSGQLVADAGPHSAITVSNGFIIWTRQGDPETNYPGAINLLAFGGSNIITLVREAAFGGGLGHNFAIQGDHVYFPAAYEIDSVPLASPGHFVTAFKSGGYAVTANSDHVFWSQSTSIVSHSLVDGSEVMIPTANHFAGPPVDAMAADDEKLYWIDSDGLLMVAPVSGGTPTVLATGAADQLYLAGGVAYWLGSDGVSKTATAGGGAATLIASEQDYIDHYAIDDRFVYWTSGHRSCTSADSCPITYHLRRQPLAGGATTTLGTLDLQSEAMAATAGHAYVLTPSGVHIF